MARAVGPLSGGFLIAGFGLGSPFLALIGLYALSLFFSFRLPKTEPSPARTTSAIREIADGLKYIRSKPVVLRLMILGLSVVFNATFVPVIPVYDGELLAIAQRRESFEATGTRVLLPPTEVVADCVDKWRTHERLAESGFLPSHALVSTAEETLHAIHGLGYPRRRVCPTNRPPAHINQLILISKQLPEYGSGRSFLSRSNFDGVSEYRCRGM